MTDSFSFKPNLEGDTISLRPICERDFEDLFLCASDKKLWEGHPSKNRYEKTVFKKWFKSAMESGSALVILDKLKNEIIGSTRFYVVDSEPEDISIGYTFIAREYWGGSTNLELKNLMLNYAFMFFDVVWFHIAPSNIRSQKATQKIGGVFSHEVNADSYGKLIPTQFFKIEKERWLK